MAEDKEEKEAKGDHENKEAGDGPGESSPPATGSPPERETTAEMPAAEHQEGAPPGAPQGTPAATPQGGRPTPYGTAPAGTPPRFGRVRDWSRRKPAQLLAAGLVGAIIGGAAVGTTAALTGEDHPGPQDRGYLWRGPDRWDERGPYGWQGPGRLVPPDGEAPPWWGHPRFRQPPPDRGPERSPSPVPTPSTPSATPTA